ncbi:hypothetical protein J132_10869, partial [Termitomyces sp. J132]
TIPSRQNPDDVRYWIAKVNKLEKKLTKSIGSSAFNYLNMLHREFIASGNAQDIFDAIVHTEKLQKWLCKYQDNILQLFGAQEEWKQSEKVSQRVSAVLRSLEDLGGYMVLPDQDWPALYASREFLYQTLLS